MAFDRDQDRVCDLKTGSRLSLNILEKTNFLANHPDRQAFLPATWLDVIVGDGEFSTSKTSLWEFWYIRARCEPMCTTFPPITGFERS
jgi:hypothetical protein